jgi:hypothetical protein
MKHTHLIKVSWSEMMAGVGLDIGRGQQRRLGL